MRAFVCLGYCLPLVVMLPGRLSAQDIWAVVSTHELDPRIAKQLGDLAAQDGAQIRVGRSAEEATQLHPKLSIELQPEEQPNSFLEKLQRMTPTSAELTAQVAREGYILQATSEEASPPERLHIEAPEARGFHNALLRVPELLRGVSGASTLAPPTKGIAETRSGRIRILTLADYPSFPARGIVEGFYGVPWSHQERLDILRFEGQHGMNVYYYAPKDDPYHRKLWREPYPPEQMKQLSELVDAARSNFVDFCFAISPGLSMAYSSDDDFSKLATKLQSVASLGVSCFALFLDDVPQELQSPEDKERFKTLAAAHASLINKLDGQLKAQSPANRLTVTPTTYTNEWGSRDYIRELGAAANSDVAIVWTGPEVVSPEITVAQAKEWGELLHRPPLVWDNFPVNDGISWRLNLGPLVGRDPSLPTAVSGLVANPMNQARASMIPLQTVADYLWNPGAYEPARSRRKAVEDQYGTDAGELLAPFLKTYGDYWWQENIFRPLFVEERRVIDAAEIEQRIGDLDAALITLRSQERFRKLASEISSFPPEMRQRLATVRGDPAFRQLPGQNLEWQEDYNAFRARRVPRAPKLDGSFAKWRRSSVYALNRRSQIVQGAKHWKGPRQFSTRVALAWDERYLYLGLEVNDRRPYQPFYGRGVDRGDAFILTLETAFRKNFERTRADGDEYHLWFSPGDFALVKPSIFSDEDYLPPRPVPRDYDHEIKTAWRKTARGFSGDIAIPVSYFNGGSFTDGYEIGLGLGAQKVIPPKGPNSDAQRIVFTSKPDRVFPLRFGNPSSYQRLVLVGPRRK